MVTDAGRRLLDAARDAARRLDEELAADLGDADRRALDQMLDELVACSIAASLASRS